MRENARRFLKKWNRKKFLKKWKKGLTNGFECGIIYIVPLNSMWNAGVAQWQSSWFVISRLMVRLRSPAPVGFAKVGPIFGGFPERPKGADCKSVVTDFGGPNPPSPTKKTHFCLVTKVRFLNDVCLRQMMWASPNDVRFANDACLTAHWGKHRIIATHSGATSCLWGKCIISRSDASFDQ